MPRGRPRRDLPHAVLAALGTDTDEVIGTRYGVSAQTIYRLRKERGIAAVKATRPSKTREAIEYAAHHDIPLSEAADLFGVRPAAAYQERSKERMSDILKPTSGDKTDTAVFRCKISGKRFVEMRLPTTGFTRADVERIHAFLVTCIDEP